MPPPLQGPAGPQAQTRDWRGLGGMGGLWSVTGLLLPLLEEPELGGEGRGGWAACRDPRPFRVLSLASRERVRGRPQGRRAGGLGLPARPDRGAHGGGPSKRETHGGVPGARPPARRVRMSVTASMSSAGSIAVGKSGGSAGLSPDPRPAPAPWERDPPTARTGRPHGRDVPHGWWICPTAGTCTGAGAAGTRSVAKAAGICPTAGTWPGMCPVAGTRTGARASGMWPRWPGCAPWPGHPHGRPQRCHGPWHGGLTPPAPRPSPVAVIGGKQSSDLRRDGVILQQEPFAGGGGHGRAGQGWSHRRRGDGEMGGRHRETAGTEEGRRGQRKATVGTRRDGGTERWGGQRGSGENSDIREMPGRRGRGRLAEG